MFFETILSGVHIDNFFRDVVGKRHNYYKGTSCLNKKISVSNIDQILTIFNGYLEDFVIVTMDGEIVYIPRAGVYKINQKRYIESLYRRGATIKIEGFETRHPVISRLCRGLEGVLGGETTAKAFITPPMVPGYSIHFDAIDTFVIQLDGTKNWKVFPQFVVMPTAIQGRKVSEEEVGEVQAEYLLEPGDVLYLPAGTPHAAYCTDKHSTHITIGLAPWRANQVAYYIINTLIAPTSETIRQHLFPSEIDEHTETKLKIALMDIASSLEKIDPCYVMKSFTRSINAVSPSINDGGIKNASLESLITKNSLFMFNYDSLHQLDIDYDNEKLYIRLGCCMVPRENHLTEADYIELPLYAAEDVEYIFDTREPFDVSSIKGVLDEESRIILLLELSKYGVVNIINV